MAFGETLKKLRMQTGLSHEEIARKLGITRSYYGHFERGIRPPPVDCLTHLADVFGLTGQTREDFLAAGYLEHAPQEVRERIERLEKAVQWMAARVAEIESNHKKTKE